MKMECFVDELVLQIFKSLDANHLIKVSGVCKKWYEVSKSQCLWKKLLLKKWPSQEWLYDKIPVNGLNWLKIYKEFVQYGWYSPDHMRYFVSCNAIEDEPICPELREVLFLRMSSIAQKWMKVSSRDHDMDIGRHFDKNMELFFNIHQLEWCFLDKRRGYLDNIYGRKSRKRTTSNNLEDFIRPYQVIPSCLLMYRFLCMFRSFAVPETGLTFYRIWRFRLKHIETGMVFELCDWKAASSSTFSNGRPNVGVFRDDALELLQFITHPHFIMHPLGLNLRIERLFFYAIRASAGGSVSIFPKRQKPTSKKHMEAVSPRVQAAQAFGNQLYEKPMFPDIEDKLERWRARRKAHLLQPPSPRPTQSNTNPFESMMSLAVSTGPSSRKSSTGNMSNPPSAPSSAPPSAFCSEAETETDSTREFGASDTDSEFDFYENGYVTNCEYFISNSESFDSIEEQHSMQASISDLWEVTSKECTEKLPVIYDIEDDNWYFQMEKQFIPHHPPRLATISLASPQSSNINQSVQDLHLVRPKRKQPASPQPDAPGVSSGHSRPPGYSEFYSLYDLTSDIIEPIPSSLALYRLICLFDFNCSVYVCLDDVSVWQVSMLHKKTRGVIHFKDYNGSFRVAVSLPEAPLLPEGTSSEDMERQEIFAMFDLSEFRAAVTQLLDLLMSENFCHPYGIIAGTVA
uniref:F-box domain-containing protein n=2 Tax=Clytia hemisphaerica TaxID=252671 RepID=A0A7M5WW63_9CNID